VYPAIDGAKLFDAMKSLESYTPYEGGIVPPIGIYRFSLGVVPIRRAGRHSKKAINGELRLGDGDGDGGSSGGG